jgi:Lrp/AsnC family transcriptional regulator, leucine-responsive regulatory protein
MNATSVDETDLRILAMLEKDARQSNAAIGAAVGLAASSVHERVKKLEARGVIKGYVAVIDPAAVGKPITAFIRLTVSPSREGDYHDAMQTVSGICRDHPDILECHHVAGEDCYVIKARTASPSGLEQLLERIRSDTEVQRSVTSIVLSTAKETIAVVTPSEGGRTP